MPGVNSLEKDQKRAGVVQGVGFQHYSSKFLVLVLLSVDVMAKQTNAFGSTCPVCLGLFFLPSALACPDL